MWFDFLVKIDKVYCYVSLFYKCCDLVLWLVESLRGVVVMVSLKFSDCVLVGIIYVFIFFKDCLYFKLVFFEIGEFVIKFKSGFNFIIEIVMVSGNGLVVVSLCENVLFIVWDLREKVKWYMLEISGYYLCLIIVDISFNGYYFVDVMKLDKMYRFVVMWDLEMGKVKYIIG